MINIGDARKTQRINKNREAARRSRLKKANLLESLMSQSTSLSRQIADYELNNSHLKSLVGSFCKYPLFNNDTTVLSSEPHNALNLSSNTPVNLNFTQHSFEPAVFLN